MKNDEKHLHIKIIIHVSLKAKNQKKKKNVFHPLTATLLIIRIVLVLMA
jgi:hypothetical protein